MSGKLIDLTGQRFSRWQVIGPYLERNRNGHTYWPCRCDCGTRRGVRGSELRAGKSTCCGCVPRHRTHGMSQTSIYRRWAAMVQRCFNPNSRAYHNYGARGIGIEWESFEELYADTGDPPPGLTLDRPDNNRSYGPSNWRWAPPSLQAANRRRPSVVVMRRRLEQPPPLDIPF